MRLSLTIGSMNRDRVALLMLMMAGALLAGQAWLHENPQHDPFAPLSLDHPPGWATGHKLANLQADLPGCRQVLTNGGVAFTALEPEGEGACRRADRTQAQAGLLVPGAATMTCQTMLGYELWLRHAVQPAAQQLFGSQVARIEHLGTYNCRRIGSGEQGDWSEHATGNGIDIAAFVLADGTRISVLNDWQGAGDEARFLRKVRDGACTSFATVLSPDYNAAHADHLHIDQAARRVGGVCR
jgi:hypothetical protein